MIKRGLAGVLGMLGAAGLAGCATVETPLNVSLPAEDGVTIATSSMALGAQNPMPVPGKLFDCGGPSVGISVETSQKDGRYIYDSNGNPCENPTTLFDGALDVSQRGADPAIQIGFHDALGPLPMASGNRSTSVDALPPLPVIKVSSQFLPVSASTEGPIPVIQPTQLATTAKPDPLTQTLKEWKAENTSSQALARQSLTQENAASAGRDLLHITAQNQAKQQQESLAKALAELREKERTLQQEKTRYATTLEQSEKNRQKSEAALESWQQQQRQLQSELEATQARLKEFEAQNQRLAHEKAQREKAYQAKVATLSGDLKAAESQASATRQELILQAAAKIAEAEQLANAAKAQEQEIKLREAARMRQEAEQMMQRALDIQAGKAILADVQGVKPAAAPLALPDVPVIVHAKDAPIEELVGTILKQAEVQAGKWTADWQLSAKAQYILKEKWSLTAEAPVSELLAQLTAQVKAAHGITLTFTQFAQSRLLVITDAQ